MTISGAAAGVHLDGMFGRGAHRDACGCGAGAGCRARVTSTGWPTRNVAGLFRQRLDQKDELGALFEAVDHRRRELRLPGNKAYTRGEAAGAAIASDFDFVAISDVRQPGLRVRRNAL